MKIVLIGLGHPVAGFTCASTLSDRSMSLSTPEPEKPLKSDENDLRGSIKDVLIDKLNNSSDRSYMIDDSHWGKEELPKLKQVQAHLSRKERRALKRKQSKL